MKMAAQVTVTAGRRGEVSAVSRGWQWRLSRCAGEEADADVITNSSILIHSVQMFLKSNYDVETMRIIQVCIHTKLY